jgi:hypothetical protein
MGEHRNGGSPPDDGGESYARDLPELPPEWGEVVVPDDLSELDAEVRAVRRELRRTGADVRARNERSGGAQSGTDVRAGDREPVALRVPIAIMVVAVLMALVSLVVMTWGRTPAPSLPSVTLSANAGGTDLSGLVLQEAGGAHVALQPLLPALLLLVDGVSEGPELVRGVAALAPGAVTVVAVGIASPAATAFPGNVRLLADPAAQLASMFSPAPGRTATAIAVDLTGRVVTVVRGAVRLADLEPITSRW